MYYEFIAIFLTPVIAFLLFIKFNDKNLKPVDNIATYGGLTLLTNILISFLLHIIRGYNSFKFTTPFFIKYSMTAIAVSSFLVMFYLKIVKNFKKIINKIDIKKLLTSIVLIILIIFSIISIKKYTSNIILYNLENTIKIKNTDKLIVFDFDTLGQQLPSSKGEGKIDVITKISTGNDEVKTYATIEVQGSSTQFWPKKNWSLKLYKDKARAKELYLRVGDSIASNKWILKADWIDPSMYRNGVSYLLWDQITESRDSSFMEVKQGKLINENAKGSPFYFTGLLNVNEQHYGITTLILGHDINNFNIDKNNKDHLYFEFDARGGYTPTKTYEKFSKDGIGTWIDSYFPKDNNLNLNQITKIDEFGKFLNSPLSEAKQNYNKYFDKENMIDMLLYIEFIYDNDGIAQDLEIVTYDLNKFYFLPWDKDTTFGLSWSGDGLLEDSEKSLLINYKNEDSSQKPWYKTYHVYTKETEERYKDLRDKGIFSAENIERLIDSIDSKLTEELRDKDKKRWPERPSVDELNKLQMLNWVQNRIEVLDKHFNYSK